MLMTSHAERVVKRGGGGSRGPGSAQGGGGGGLGGQGENALGT